jgi:serine/threonine protein kinase
MSEPSNTRPPSALEEGSDALPAGIRLAELEIREVLGAGGFGIVYRAWDDALQRDVALKEYMPVSLAGRSSGERVTLRSRMNEEDFALGLQSFVNEARLLARFDQPALVKVLRFWEANGTAYMAMPIYKGRTLRQLRKEATPGTFDDAWTRALIEPLLGALEAMHGAEVYHRDIAPDNILWCDDGRPVLLDFGAARHVLSDRTQNVTAILKPQFAPIEQYAETQSMRQGPWTDLYALAGTCYFLLTGRAPLPATARVMGDELVPLVRLAPPGCSPRLLQILDWAMAVRPQDRPQSVAQMRDALAGRLAVPVRDATDAFAPTLNAGAASAGFEKTVQVGRNVTPPPRPPRPPSGPPAPRSRHHGDDDLERPERSVMLPPKSQSPLKALLFVLVLASAAAGAWMTRLQWMPALGLATAALPAAQSASSPAALASAASAARVAAAAAPAAVAEPASAVASGTLAAADVVAAPASAAASLAPLAAVAAPPPVKPARTRSMTDARSKALAARIAALTLPPPVLPPADESHVVAPGQPGARPSAEAAAPAAPAPAPASPPAPTAQHAQGPREACADLDKKKAGSCIKQMCEDERYRGYPICQRLRRLEQRQQGASE